MTQVNELEPLTFEQIMKVTNLTRPKFIGLARVIVREVQV